MDAFPSVETSSGKHAVAYGIVAILLGIMAMVAPAIAGVSIVLVLGLLVTCAGILRMLWAFRAGSFGKGLLTFALGALTLVCGVAMLANPLFGAGVLTLVVAFYLVVDGATEIALGIEGHGPMMVLGGCVSMLLGILIWSQYPLSGLWAIGLLMGIKLASIGLIMIASGSSRHVLVKG